MNRRSYPRLVGPFPGSFTAGKVRNKACRIADLSLGGCFVQSQQTAEARAPVTVAIDLDGIETISVKGTIVAEEWGTGFG